MMGEDEPVQSCKLSESANLRTALEAAAIEFLDVDEHRTIVIYQQAILMVIATEGKATTAQEFDVELWKEPPNDPDRDPESLFAAFIDELVTTTGTTRR
ncbi:hypothetical protein PNP59_03055 [Halobacterium salinarum]|uniref:hypothetical protein n=1 Tax=Halobacterium salinarum TaxID=2242 RepID=UPI002555F43C|nr:hypothetical protein [Halobacterium salinarum]MDL0129916.1 hypothetical protein [Halobacterium salinarum]